MRGWKNRSRSFDARRVLRASDARGAPTMGRQKAFKPWWQGPFSLDPAVGLRRHAGTAGARLAPGEALVLGPPALGSPVALVGDVSGPGDGARRSGGTVIRPSRASSPRWWR